MTSINASSQSAGLRLGALVVYKNRPARLVDAGSEKLEIELRSPNGPLERLKVRPKDVTILHPGPLARLDDIAPVPAAGAVSAEVLMAWELIGDQPSTLVELAELAYGAYTPASAWAVWLLLQDGVYFRGTPDRLHAQAAAAIQAEQDSRQAKHTAQEAHAALLERLRHNQLLPEDQTARREIEDLALGRRETSRLFEALGKPQRPETAHAMLLASGAWDITANPYPERQGVLRPPASAPLPPLPDEPRRDLTHLPAFAIDDVGNTEPDDAVSLELVPGQPPRLWVHIADVAALVTPESPADQEARARGATLYLPEGNTSMLPAEATARLGLGLQPVSPALSFGIELDDSGAMTGVEITPSWVKVVRLSYDQAELYLDDQAAPTAGGEIPSPSFDYTKKLRALDALARRAFARRLRLGAANIELPEVMIKVQDGAVTIRPLPPLRSRALVREAMLLAGEAAARFAQERGIPFVYASQPPSSATPVAEPPSPEAAPFPDLLESYARRRTQARAQVSTHPGAHAGLGLEIYGRVTSPLRRALDLAAHQQLRATLGFGAPIDEQEMIARLGDAEAMTPSLNRAEFLSERHWTLVYLLQHPGWQGEAVVVDRSGLKPRLLIPELALEINMPLPAAIPLGARVRLALQGVNLPELDVSFRVM
jgi:exoribonuclease II